MNSEHMREGVEGSVLAIDREMQRLSTYEGCSVVGATPWIYVAGGGSRARRLGERGETRKLETEVETAVGTRGWFLGERPSDYPNLFSAFSPLIWSKSRRLRETGTGPHARVLRREGAGLRSVSSSTLILKLQ